MSRRSALTCRGKLTGLAPLRIRYSRMYRVFASRQGAQMGVLSLMCRFHAALVPWGAFTTLTMASLPSLQGSPTGQRQAVTASRCAAGSQHPDGPLGSLVGRCAASARQSAPW